MAPRCFPPSRLNQLTVRPSISRIDADRASLRCPKTGVGGAVTRWTVDRGARIRVALWPPKPNEFDSTGVALDRPGRAPKTTSRPMSSPIFSRLAVGGTMPSRSDSRLITASAAPAAADHVAGDALGRRDRRRGVAEHLADGLGLGRVVERRGRAVRVHVPDRGGVEPGVVERELHARGRAGTAGRRAR